MQQALSSRTKLLRTLLVSGLSFFTIAGVAGATTVTSSALTFTGAASISSATTSAITVDSGSTGAVNLGTGAAAKTVTVGNNTTTSAVAITSGTGDVTVTSTDDASITTTDDLTLNGGSAGSIIAIGTNTHGDVINIGTDDTTADTIAIGSAKDTSSLSGISVTVGSTGTTSATTIQSGTGAVTVTGETIFGSSSNVSYAVQTVLDATATLTLTPTSSFVLLQCNRSAADTAVTLSETGARAGQVLEIAVDTSNNAGTCSFADSAGVQMTTGATLDDSDTIKFVYTGSEWDQVSTSNN